MENEKQIRKRLFRRDLKKELLLMLVSIGGLVLLWWLVYALPGSVRRAMTAAATIFSIPLLIMLYMCISWLIRVRRWPLTEGTVEEVFLDDKSPLPMVFARVTYDVDDGSRQQLQIVLSAYGDYEDGCEPKLQKMLSENKEKYENTKIPVFYSPADPKKGIVVLQEAKKIGCEDGADADDTDEADAKSDPGEREEGVAEASSEFESGYDIEDKADESADD